MKKFVFSAVLVMISLFVMPFQALEADAAENFAKGWDGDSENIGLYDEYGLFDEE